MAQGRLQQELKKKRPFDSLEEEALLNLLRTNDRVHIRFARLFRQHGLTLSQYNVLRILRGEGQPLPILEIAARTITAVPGITGLIDRLERAGLVCRRRCEQDRRVIYVGLTTQGETTITTLDRPLARLHHEVLGHLSAAELRELVRLLERVRAPLTGADD